MTNIRTQRALCRAAEVCTKDVAYDPHLLGATSWVPYISSWTGESQFDDLSRQIIERPDGAGIAYPRETVLDRDEYGVLWSRPPSCVGLGRPLFGEIHATRQRHAIRNLLCQVCARPADRDENGVLFLLNDHRGDWPGWPNRMANVQPPLCRPCARASVRLCPSLRHGVVAIRSTRHPIAGVAGGLYRPAFPRPKLVGRVDVAYSDSASGWVLASHLVREFQKCTFLDIADLS